MKKYNYAVMKSIFGDIWVGKIKLPTEEDKIFDDIQDVINKATDEFEHCHFDFDFDDEDNNDMELQDQYNNLIYASEGDVDEIKKGMEKFIV